MLPRYTEKIKMPWQQSLMEQYRIKYKIIYKSHGSGYSIVIFTLNAFYEELPVTSIWTNSGEGF